MPVGELHSSEGEITVDENTEWFTAAGATESHSAGRRLMGVIWGGQALSILLSGATTISLSLWAYATTGDVVDLALMAALRIAVSIYLSPFAGSLADRVHRKSLVAGANVGLGCTATMMFFLTGAARPGANVGFVFIVMVASGVLDSILVSALAASVRDLRRATTLTRTSALISLVENTPLVVAPLAGALLFETCGISVVLALDTMSFIAAAVAAGCVRWPSARSLRGSGPRKRRWAPFEGAASGLRLIWSNGDYRRLQLGNAAINVANGLATTGVSVFLLSEIHGSPQVLGLYNSSAAIGLVAGSVLVGLISLRFRRSTIIACGMLVAAVGGRVLLGATAWVPVWVGSGVTRSIGTQLTNIPLTAIWMEAVPSRDQGKVFGARRLLGQGGYPVAVLCGGLIVEGLESIQWPGTLGAWLIALGVLEASIGVTLACSGVLGRVAASSVPPPIAPDPVSS